ncbi:MAG: citrate synthase [Chitinophagaceae bacterium]|nr:citrate synthase [Oligoflexus sp.]
MTSKPAELNYDGHKIEFQVTEGSEGERGIDINKLRDATGLVTIDNGFMNTAATSSAVTFLDGEKGILRYRGYPIEELAEKSTFIEVSYLLLYGELPTATRLKWFEGQLAKHSDTKEGIKTIIKAFPKEAHPMGIASAAVVALSGFYPEYSEGHLTEAQKDEVFPLLMAQLKNIAAYQYRASQGKDLVDAQPKKFDYVTDFLFQMTGKDVDPEVSKALNILLILHADHEQNCSTSSVRLVGSSQANVFASISAGVDALWGPLHGGANQAVIEMLQEIQADGGDYKKFILKAKNKDDNFRLMGFGHRVYKNFDPRAKIIKKACDTILEKLKIKDPLLAIAKGLEEEALKDQYFVERKLYPNVDFYSGIIYKALNIPTNMFTVMFALGRLPGWEAQWKEMVETPSIKIGRPRQIYVGSTERHYQAITERK